MSIFNLIQSASELSSSNMGTARMRYEQVACSRDITGNNFPNGSQYFRWEVQGNKWFIPNRSYFRIRCKLTKPDGTPLSKGDDVAYQMNFPPSLYQSMEMRMSNKTVDRISDYVAQIDTLKKRMNKSKAFMDGYGKSAYMMAPLFEDRQAQTMGEVESYDTLLTRARTLEGALIDEGADTLAWTSATGTFTWIDAAGGDLDVRNAFRLDVGDTIEATVSNSKIRGVVTAVTALTIVIGATADVGDVAAAVANNGAFNIRKVESQNSLGLDYAPRSVGSTEVIWQPPLSMFDLSHALPAGKYELMLNPQTANVYNKLVVESQLADKVHGVDYIFVIEDMYLYLATIQGPRVSDLTYLIDMDQMNCQLESVDNNVSLQQKRFDVHESTNALTMAFQDNRVLTDTRYSSTKLRTDSGNELDLSRFYLDYAGQQRPAPDASPNFDDSIDYTVHRYHDSMSYVSSIFDTGSPETIEDFHERGTYHHFLWPKDAHDRSVRVTANYQFKNADQNRNVFLFNHFKRVVTVVVKDGKILDVVVQDA